MQTSYCNAHTHARRQYVIPGVYPDTGATEFRLI